MEVIDRRHQIPEFKNRKSVILEFGCGTSPRVKDAISVDILDIPGVDIVADVNDGLGFLEDATIDEIHSFHFLEHINNLELFIRESLRVLKPGGKICGLVPHFSNPYFYSDYTHKNFFGLYSFSYFSKNQPFTRKVPVFYTDLDLDIEKIKLIFRSPFYIRNKCRRLFGYLINSSGWMQEFYEENLTGIISTYEIEFTLVKKRNAATAG